MNALSAKKKCCLWQGGWFRGNYKMNFKAKNKENGILIQPQSSERDRTTHVCSKASMGHYPACFSTSLLFPLLALRRHVLRCQVPHFVHPKRSLATEPRAHLAHLGRLSEIPLPFRGRRRGATTRSLQSGPVWRSNILHPKICHPP